jgi:hypothetical protein
MYHLLLAFNFLAEYLCGIFAGLVGNGAGCFAGALTARLAFSAARMFSAPNVRRGYGLNMLHHQFLRKLFYIFYLYNTPGDFASFALHKSSASNILCDAKGHIPFGPRVFAHPFDVLPIT